MRDNPSPFNAGKYEEGILKTLPFYEMFYTETISLVKYLMPDVHVWLDTGCGTGSLVYRAYPAFSDTTFLLSDPSSEMLDRAMENLKDIPENQLKIVGNVGTGELTSLSPYKPQVITAILAHHYLDKKGRMAATKKCCDLLEDGGVYVTFENIYPLTEEGRDIGLGRWKAFQLSQGKTEEEADNHIKRYNKSYFPITIEEHLNLLRDSGFRTAELFWFSHMQAGFYAIK